MSDAEVDVLNDLTTKTEESDELSSNGDNECNQSGDEQLDPRIAENLERLNAASEEVNRLERELGGVRVDFRETLNESGQKLTALKNGLKKAIERAKPFYEARFQERKAHAANQRATRRYEKATSMHKGSIEMVAVAERSFVPSRGVNEALDTTWVETLNHANERFVETEKEKNLAEMEHLRSTEVYEKSRLQMTLLQRKLKSVIEKSRPFFVAQGHYFLQLEKKRRHVHELQKKLLDMKAEYSDAMVTLERVSKEIHQKRQLKRQLRERKLERAITVSVEDNQEDLNDVDGMVRNLAAGLGVDPMGSLDSLQSEVSSSEVFDDDKCAGSSNDVSSSEQSSRGMNAENDAVVVALLQAASNSTSTEHSVQQNETETGEKGHAITPMNDLEEEQLELSREQEHQEKQREKDEEEKTMREVETDNRQEEEPNNTHSEIIEDESLDVGKDNTQSEHQIGKLETGSQENDVLPRQKHEDASRQEEETHETEKETDKEVQTERQTAIVNERHGEEQATRKDDMESMSREQTEETEDNASYPIT